MCQASPTRSSSSDSIAGEYGLGSDWGVGPCQLSSADSIFTNPSNDPRLPHSSLHSRTPHGPAVVWSVSRRDTFCQSFAKLTLYALNEALIRGRSAYAAVSRHQIRGPTASAEKTADPSPRSTATAVRTTLLCLCVFVCLPSHDCTPH